MNPPKSPAAGGRRNLDFTVLEFKVALAQSGQRLDLFLAAQLPTLSRRKIRQVIDVGGAQVNGRRIKIASRQLARGDFVRVEYSVAALSRARQKPRPLDRAALLFDGGGVLAIDKPPGIPSQATLDPHAPHLLPMVKSLLGTAGDGKRRELILVHRLDKETTGVILLADGAATATHLTEQFRERRIKKVYLALCAGVMATDEIIERAPLSPIDQRTGEVRPVRSGGRSALTVVRRLGVNRHLGVTLVACYPATGRSHQIRVHLAINDLPILGDKRYGGANLPTPAAEIQRLTAEHHLLHAYAVTFLPMSGTAPRTIVAPLPANFAGILALSNLEVPNTLLD